jgi:hypothetical protein
VFVFWETLRFAAAGSSCALIGCFDYFKIASQGIGLPILPEGA